MAMTLYYFTSSTIIIVFALGLTSFTATAFVTSTNFNFRRKLHKACPEIQEKWKKNNDRWRFLSSGFITSQKNHQNGMGVKGQAITIPLDEGTIPAITNATTNSFQENNHFSKNQKSNQIPTITYPHVYVPQNKDGRKCNSNEGDLESNNNLDCNWINEAVHNLQTYGMCALLRTPSQPDNHKYNLDKCSSNLIDPQVCNRANEASTNRLAEMHNRISRRNMDPKGLADGPYRFMEVICRDEGGRRYDLPVPWLGDENDVGCDDDDDKESNDASRPKKNTKVGSAREGAPLSFEEREAVEVFHKNLDCIVRPILDGMWGDELFSTNGDTTSYTTSLTSKRYSYVAASGFLVNEPGSISQNWHRDGPDPGYIDVFVPLIDLKEELGPTALRPGTHVSYDIDSVADPYYHNDEIGGEQRIYFKEEVAPLLQKGEVLMFDYRTFHRGQGNRSSSTTRSLAYVVYKQRKKVDAGEKDENQTSAFGNSENASGDIHNFPAALTLEYD